ncbi:MAG: hypothetical protein AAF533_03835 [Acidobacteriota bacterium]
MNAPTRFDLHSVLFTVLTAAFVAAVPTTSHGRQALRLASTEERSLRETADALEAAGARIRHLVAPDLLFGDIPAAAIEAARGRGFELDVVQGGGAFAMRRGAPGSAGAPTERLGSRATLLADRFRMGFPSLPGSLPPGGAFVGDALPPDPRDGLLSHAVSGGCSPGGKVLVGRVAIGVFMLESDGSVDPDTEDWTTEDPSRPGVLRTDLVVSEIMEGMDALISGFPAADLSFAYDPQVPVIPYEPINRPAAERWQWGGAAFDAMGYGGFSGGLRDYLEDLKQTFDADWATVAFILDSLNDPDGYPSEGNFAYAILGGGYLVMTYDNNGWGIDGMDVVMAHELGHNFGALDEYASAGNSCGRLAGFLRVKNGNNASGPGDAECESTDRCFMRADRTLDACAFTAGQLGIRDSDGDGILDVRDAPPDSSFDGPLFRIFETDSPTLTGDIGSYPDAAESLHSPPIAINRVTAAEYRLDGGAWTPVPAADGAFGDRCESVEIALSGLGEGLHVLELRGTNDVGLVEPSPARLELYVNTDCRDDAGEDDDDAASAIPRPAGRHAPLFRCAYDEDWSRLHLAAGATFEASVVHGPELTSITLRLLNEGQVELASATSSGSIATLRTTARSDGPHYLVVEGVGEDEGSYELLLVADCIDDPREPNELWESAPAVEPGLSQQLVLCEGDSDHFRIAVQAGETLTAEIDFEHALGDLDLVLLDPAGAELDFSNGTTDSERVEVTPTVEGVHAIRVLGKDPTDENLYTLLVTTTGCVDDLRENDDSPADAIALSRGESVAGELCAGDEDWFSFSVDEVSLVRLQLAHDVGVGNLDLELHRAALSGQVGRSSLLTSPEDITVERLPPGDYLVRVFSDFGEGASYSLSLQAEDPVLLFVTRNDTDAILDWNDAGQECYTVLRSDDVSDFSAARRTLVNDPPGDEDAEPRLEFVDEDVLYDGVELYGYLVRPHDCGEQRLRATKTVDPQPCYQVEPGVGNRFLTYTIQAENTGTADLIGVTLLDSVEWPIDSFRILSIPPGSTDVSAHPDIRIEGIDIPVGQIATVVVQADLPTPYFNEVGLIISNQAQWCLPSDGVTVGDCILTDDPSTRAPGDDTRTAYYGDFEFFDIACYWHGEVDIDLRVIDPCGNVFSERDGDSGTCGASSGWLQARHSCASPSYPGRNESVIWYERDPEPGNYRIELSYIASAAEDADCSSRGPEEITVMVAGPAVGGLLCQTVTLLPGDDSIPVLELDF